MNHINIKNPCHLKWDSLDGKGCERFCISCATSVIDLTQKSNSEIVDLVMRQKGRVCGKIRQDQVDRIWPQNRANTGISKSLLMFFLGFATITTSQAKSNQLSLAHPEPAISSSKSSNIGLKSIERFKEDSLIIFNGQVLGTEDNLGLPGVNIILKGTEIKTRTDAQGNFELKINKNKVIKQNPVLIFSFIGFAPKEVEFPPMSQGNIIIKLKADAIVLGEIHIPSYKRIWWKMKSLFRKDNGYSPNQHGS